MAGRTTMAFWLGTTMAAAAGASVVAAGCERARPLDPALVRAQQEAEVRSTVIEAARMLEAGQYVAFLDRYLPPEEKAQFLDGQPLVLRARTFGEKVAPKLLGKLRAAESATAIFNADRTEARYPVPQDPDFTLIRGADGRWRIRN